MKSLSNYIINESKFLNNLHDSMNDIEIQLTNKLAKLISSNNVLTVNVDGTNINFLTNSEEDNNEMYELYSAAGILVEKYLSFLLKKEIESEDYFGSDFERMITHDNLDNGSYDSYDLTLGNSCFEIKCYHKLDNDGIYISDKQKKMGPDVYLIFVQVGIGKNNIMIKDVVVRQFKNLKVSGKYIKGTK